MPAAAGNHPGHQPGTTPDTSREPPRTPAGHHAGPPRHRPGSTAVRPQRTQFRVSDAAPAGGRRSAAYPDTGAPLACGNQTRFDGVRLLVTGNSRICPDSAAARLRCKENGFGSLAAQAARPMNLARLTAVKAAPWPSPYEGDPAGLSPRTGGDQAAEEGA